MGVSRSAYRSDAILAKARIAVVGTRMRVFSFDDASMCINGDMFVFFPS